MKTKRITFLRTEWMQVVLALLPAASALLATPFATGRVPMQWGLDGRVNWYAPPSWGLLVVPGALLLTVGIVFLMERRDTGRLDPESGNLTAHGRAVRFIRLVVSAVLGAITLLQIAIALGHHPDAGCWVGTMVALLTVMMGNVFGKLRPNRYVGIRVPWTLGSESVWRKTHRFAGRLYTVTGLLVMAAVWLLPAGARPGILLGWIGLLIVPPLLVAWRASLRERASGGVSC